MNESPGVRSKRRSPDGPLQGTAPSRTERPCGGMQQHPPRYEKWTARRDSPALPPGHASQIAEAHTLLALGP